MFETQAVERMVKPAHEALSPRPHGFARARPKARRRKPSELRGGSQNHMIARGSAGGEKKDERERERHEDERERERRSRRERRRRERRERERESLTTHLGVANCATGVIVVIKLHLIVYSLS